jgi:sterol desaturase/sphingolipid hydroxylase (fatty acid hydroxylase superfamily)
MTRLASIALLSLLFGTNSLVLYATMGDAHQPLVLAGLNLGLLVLGWGLERICPMHADWNKAQGDVPGDAASLGLIAALDDLLGQATPFVLLWLWPLTLPALPVPLWVQVLGALVVLELGSWASHYAHHRFMPLWAFHATHHAGTRLYTLNNTRFHPVNHILNHAAMLLPALLLGFPVEAITMALAIVAPVVLLQHSNIGFDFGRLNLILNTIEVHRWHHSADPDEAMTNFGRALIIWDHVFGTYHNPTASKGPERLGLFSTSTAFPRANQFIAQLIWPFTPACCRRA